MEATERSEASRTHCKNWRTFATEGALHCDGIMTKVAASFGGELMAFHRDENLTEQHFGSKGLLVLMVFFSVKRLRSCLVFLMASI